MANNNYLTITNHTSDHTIVDSESGSVHTNYGAVGVVIFTLPTAPSRGDYYIFFVAVAQQLRINPTVNSIISDFVMGGSGTIWANAIGEHTSLIANENKDWIIKEIYGTWTEVP